MQVWSVFELTRLTLSPIDGHGPLPPPRQFSQASTMPRAPHLRIQSSIAEGFSINCQFLLFKGRSRPTSRACKHPKMKYESKQMAQLIALARGGIKGKKGDLDITYWAFSSPGGRKRYTIASWQCKMMSKVVLTPPVLLLRCKLIAFSTNFIGTEWRIHTLTARSPRWDHRGIPRFSRVSNAPRRQNT